MQNVFLNGLSGNGKSTVDRILAERLGKPLMDIDVLIEKESEPPIVLVRRVHIGEGYNVVVDWGGLRRLGQNLKMLNLPPRVFLITDSNVRDKEDRSEEHTSELQSRFDLVCRLLLEKKNITSYMS